MTKYMRNSGHGCSVDGCPRAAERKGWCERHYRRAYRNGDPVARPPRTVPPSTTYGAAHMRVTRALGRAADLPCVDCGEPAFQWSYDGLDPDEAEATVNGSEVTYSHKPEHYWPRCVACHRAYDRASRDIPVSSP